VTVGGSTNRAHWEDWASTYGSDLRATTKCHSIKRLELDAISRRIDGLGGTCSMLEVGCGNGYNGLALANRHPELRYLGLDFSA
jgi:tRNA G46 methylase TrmB